MHKKEDCKHLDDEIIVCNTVFKFDLNQVDANTFTLLAIPCHTPTAVFDIATIKVRRNTCNGLTYYQAFINSDPVEIIQDCSLCNIIARAIEIYFEHMEPIQCTGNRNDCRCRNNNFFGF